MHDDCIVSGSPRSTSAKIEKGGSAAEIKDAQRYKDISDLNRYRTTPFLVIEDRRTTHSYPLSALVCIQVCRAPDRNGIEDWQVFARFGTPTGYSDHLLMDCFIDRDDAEGLRAALQDLIYDRIFCIEANLTEATTAYLDYLREQAIREGL